MAAPPLSEELAREALEALSQHGFHTKAAQALGIPLSTFKSRVRRAASLSIEAKEDEPLYSAFEEAWRQWQKAIGMAKDHYKPPTRRSAIGTKKYVVLPDLHAPFHEADMLATLFHDEADADCIVGIGDLGDSYALSRFEQYETMPYRDEWASVNLVMQEMASRFPEVLLILGNHDVRLERQLRTRLTKDMVDAISFMTGGVLCPITAMAKRYPNVTIANHTTPSGHDVGWFTSIGDAWFGHPEKFSRVPGSVLRSVEEWLDDNKDHFGLDSYRMIVVGHTHQMAVLPWRSNTLLVECGCLCKTQGYMTSARIGGRPQRRGYVTFVQHHGKTDLNSVKLRWLDAEL